MPKIEYGTTNINYTFLKNENLTSHYITVQKHEGVILKGKPISEEKANQLVLKKARWILKKLELVEAIEQDDIVTGSRMPYLGRNYYVQLIEKEGIDKVKIEFTASKFKVYVPEKSISQAVIREAFFEFYRQKAKEKITPRLRKWSKETGLNFSEVKFMKLEKRWGSCTVSNNIIINIEAIKLPFDLIDYILIHELTHTKVKNHSPKFWNELSKHLPNWKKFDEEINKRKT